MIIDFNIPVGKYNYINLGVHCSKHYIPKLDVLDFLKMVGYIQNDGTSIEMENLKDIKLFRYGSIFNIYVSNEFADIITCTFIDKKQNTKIKEGRKKAIVLNWKQNTKIPLVIKRQKIINNSNNMV